MEQVMIDPVQKGNPPALIILIGFRATGKTVVGEKVAALLGYRFMDTDAEITRRLGCSISDSVALHGWQPFRDIERELLNELTGEQRIVVATGGGSVIHQEVWPKLSRRALVVWLRADAATTMSRLIADEKTAGQRPSLIGQELKKEIPLMLKERTPLYRALSDLVVDTENRNPAELAEYIIDQLRYEQKKDTISG